MSHLLLKVYTDAVIKEVKIGIGGGERMEITWPFVCK